MKAIVYGCVYVCAYMFLRIFFHSYGDQTTMGTGSSLLWVLEIKLRSSGLAASAFTLHAIPLLSVEYDSADENGSSPALLRNDTIFLRRMVQCRIQIALLLLTSDSGCLDYR